MATVTLKLTLTDSGDPYSSATSTPITVTGTYKEARRNMVDASVSGAGNADTFTTPNIYILRGISGSSTLSLNKSSTPYTTPTTTEFNGDGTIIVLSNCASGGQIINRFSYTGTNAVFETFSYRW